MKVVAMGPIVPFHKSQWALWYLDPMSKNLKSRTPPANALWPRDWPSRPMSRMMPVSLVSVQPVIGWLKGEVARHWSHIVHRPRPHGNLPLPCIVRNVVWYCVKYSSLKSFYVLQSHPASIPNQKMKFCGSVVWVRRQQIEKCILIFWWSVRCSYHKKSAKPGARVAGESWYFVCSKINQNGMKFRFKVDWRFITTMTLLWHRGYTKLVKQKAVTRNWLYVLETSFEWRIHTARRRWGQFYALLLSPMREARMARAPP